MSFRSIKFQLFMMVLIMGLFAGGIIVYSGVSFRKHEIREAITASEMLADSLYNEHEKIVGDIRQLMLTLAQLPDIKKHDAAEMKEILREILSANPKYSNIFVADQTGIVWASAAPARDTNVSDRRYFKNAMATGRLSSGEFIISRFTGKPVITFGYPFKDRKGGILGIIVIGIDMRYYKATLDTLQLPSGSSYLLLDHKGTIMTRAINPKDFLGEQYDSQSFKRMAKGPDKDTFVAVAHDGIERFITYRKIRLQGEQTPYMYIRSGIPVATALAAANTGLTRNITLFAASLFVFIVFIYILAKRLIIDRIATLERASRRLASGDLDFRVSELVSGGELGRLGLTFDDMARQIASREEALGESEQRYHALFEQSPYGVLLIDTEGKIMDFNEAAYRDLGYTREEFGHLTIADLNPAESAVDIKPRLRRILKEGSAAFVTKQRTRQGEMRVVHVITKVITLSGRTFFHSIWRDITERKRVQAEKDRLLQAISSATEGIAITDEEDRIIYMNEALARIYGYPHNELSGKTWRALITPELVPAIEDALPKTLHQKAIGAWSGESTALKKDGTIIPTEVTATSRWDEDDRYLGHICIVRDITERKRAEDKLRLFSEAVEEAPDGVQIVDLSGNVIYSNKATERIYGFSPQECYGRHVAEMNADPEFAEEFILPQIRETGQWTGELMVKHKGGRIFPVWLTTSLVKNKAGEPIAMIGIIRDVSERKKVEEEIMNLNHALLRRATDLERAYKDMESFNYAASNDLKAPVVRIAGFAEILSEDYGDRLDDYGRNCLSRISENAGKMRQLIEDLLAFSSITAREIQKAQLDMELLTRSAYDEINLPIAGRNIRIQITAMPEAYGDVSLMRQVLLNLLANATKFTKTRENAIIEVGGRTEQDENIYYIRDNGMGFDMRFADKLFGLFQRIHISGEFEGTGIGLVIVKRIIERHGGTVWAEGTPNKGATFYFSLPREEYSKLGGVAQSRYLSVQER